MLAESQVSVMFELWKKKWSIKRLAEELGHDRKTVRKWVRHWSAGHETTDPRVLAACGGKRLGRPPGPLSTVDPMWVRERFEAHGGNADVVRQEVQEKTGKSVSLRVTQRAVQGLRDEIRAAQLATVRFETPPGKQMQVDFGTKTVAIAGVATRVHVCVLTLAWSRKVFVRAWQAERQAHWFTTFEEAFLAFGGVPGELLVDNARALVTKHKGDEPVEFNAEFKAFCEHWGLTARACRPFRARTKGKDESMVKYVKRNALAGRSFESWHAMEEHLERWTREVADVRIHGTTRVPPAVRFEEEKQALTPLRGQPRYLRRRILRRRVHNDCVVHYEGNSYSAPWTFIGKEVELVVEGKVLQVWLRGKEIATHVLAPARANQRVIDPAHLKDVIRLQRREENPGTSDAEKESQRPGHSALLRPLEEYAALCVGGEA